MIDYMIPLIEAWIPLWSEYLVYFFALGFLVFFGSFVHYLIRR